MASVIITMNKHLKYPDGKCLNSATIYTAAKRRSVMYKTQYDAYGRYFGRKIPIREPKRRSKGFGGMIEVIGEVTIQIAFLNLKLIINVDSFIVEEEPPSLLSNKYMIDDGIYIRLQGGLNHITHLRQPLFL